MENPISFLKNRKIIDITGELENNLWGYYSLPGLEKIVPPVEINTIATVEKQGFFASKISISTISGTYLEAGSHVLTKGKNLDQHPLSQCILPAKVIQLPTQKPKALITADLLIQYSPEINPGDALLIGTGWDQQWNKPGFVLDSPNLDRKALQWIIDKKIALLGVDLTCIEASWSENNEEAKGNLLGSLFESGALLLAPIVNVRKITQKEGILIALPMKVKGTSGAPVRAIFLE